MIGADVQIIIILSEMARYEWMMKTAADMAYLVGVDVEYEHWCVRSIS